MNEFLYDNKDLANYCKRKKQPIYELYINGKKIPCDEIVVDINLPKNININNYLDRTYTIKFKIVMNHTRHFETFRYVIKDGEEYMEFTSASHNDIFWIKEK